jgi:hypothetical protein
MEKNYVSQWVFCGHFVLIAAAILVIQSVPARAQPA